MASLFERYGRHAGLLAPSVFIVLTAAALMNYRGYSPMTHYVSDLGVNPHSAGLFNLGILLSGIAGIAFALYLWKRFPPGPAKSGAFVMGAALVFFTMLSVFTEADFSIHLFFAGMFFSLALCGIILVGAGLRHEYPGVGVLSLALASLILPLPLSAFHPLSEHLAAGAVLAWSLLMWHHMGGRDSYLRYEWIWM